MEPPLRPWTLLATLAAALALGLHATEWWFYVSDDTFISLRYADRLLAGHGLTWTDGPPVEGYSNLLWVLLVAALGALGLDLLVATRILGLLCGLGAVAILCMHLGRKRAIGAWVGGFSVAASCSVALWIPGGLEQPLVVLLMAWALAGLGRGLDQGDFDQGPDGSAVVGPAIALSLLVWTRPDTPILVAGLALGWFLAAGQDRRALQSAALLAGLPLLAFLAQLLFRMVVYDDVVPNTAHVKVRPSEAHTDAGALWTAQALDVHLPLLALAALSVAAWPRREAPRARLRLALPVLGAWLAWLVWVGGDIFPAFRHFAPMVVVLAWLAGSGAAGLAMRRWWWSPVLGLLAPLALVWMVRGQLAHPGVSRAHNEGWVRVAVQVGAALGEAFSDAQPLVAVSPAGGLPYASRLPTLDMIGLNDAHIARSQTDGRGWIGHETGDGDYVFAQRPELIFFCGPKGGPRPCFPSEKQLVARPDFAETYALVRMEAPGDEPVVFEPWLRRSGPLGVEEERDEDGALKALVVPGLALTELGGLATQDAHHRYALEVGPAAPAGAVLTLPPGRWRAAAPPGARATLLAPGESPSPSGAALTQETRVALRVTAEAPTRVEAVRVERVGAERR